jgi:hypothetical protein
LFALGSFLKIAPFDTIFWLHFSTAKVNFGKKWVWLHFGQLKKNLVWSLWPKQSLQFFPRFLESLSRRSAG